MKAYIAIKYSPETIELMTLLKEIVSNTKYEAYAFIDEGPIEDEKVMMQQALSKLKEADILIVEGSDCSIGIGIESGYFLQTEKPIIALFKEKSISRTLQGIASKTIVYSSYDDLRSKLSSLLNQ